MIFFSFGNFLQNGHRRPFWMSEIHFRSHFWSFQIDTQLYLFLKFLTKWLQSAILDVRNSLSIAFLAILDQYIFCFHFFTKWPPAPILDVLNSLSMSFNRICGHFRSIRIFFFFLQNGRGCVADENIIFPKTYVSREYNNIHYYSA